MPDKILASDVWCNISHQECGHNPGEHCPLRHVHPGDWDLPPHRGRPLWATERGTAETAILTTTTVPHRFVQTSSVREWWWWWCVIVVPLGGGGRSRKNSRDSWSSRKSFSATPPTSSAGPASVVRCRSMKEKQSKNLPLNCTSINIPVKPAYVEIFLDKKHRGYKRSKTTDLSQKSSEQLLSVDSTIQRSRSQVGGNGR